jgi:hypothetical protein
MATDPRGGPLPDHGFDIIGRTQWSARPPTSRDMRTARSVDTVYIHWPGASGSLASINTPAEERQWMRDTQRFHMETRGWVDFAYNYAIFRSGRVYAGRTFRVVPASQAPFNTPGVSICCVLGPPDPITHAMQENLFDFVRWCEKYARHDLAVKGHRQVNSTSCPGEKLMLLVPRLNRL